MDRMESFIPSQVIGTPGYMDPDTIKSGDVTQMSDIYSFGVVLCEVMCGRKAFLPYESEDNMFLTRLVDIHLVNNTLEDIQIQDVWNQMDLKSWINFARVAFMCLLPDRTERISADTVFFNLNQQLKTHLDAVTPTSPFAANDDVLELPPQVVTVESTSSNTWKVNKLEHLRIGLIDIQLATNNFSKESELLSDDYYGLYKGDLEWFDKKFVSSLDGKNKGELPKRHYNVRIMRINDATAVDSTCKHDNIDSLLGFCDEDSHMILVYE
nr:protein kinase-like domain, concanavalin A-like lectin/glucanase domain protein [Tanacetum cinerariifolium]